MRIVLAIVLLSTTALTVDRAAAQFFPTVNEAWCADYNGGFTNCGFMTLVQCRAAISGIGGNCRENVAYQGGVQVERVRPRKRHQQ